MKHLLPIAALAASLGLAAGAANGQTLVASYSFANTLASSVAGAPSLVSVDPLGQNSFQTALVNGVSQTVFSWSGTGDNPANNAGLKLDATGLVSYDNYSVSMKFEFTELPAFGNGWRRIMDTQNRQSDIGFYVDPGERLQVYPVVTGSTFFTTGVFHDVVLTNYVVGGVREVKAYLDGVLELTSDTDQINLDNANNPGHLLYFFTDNLVGGAEQEFADGKIASLQLYDGIVVPTSPVPEPSTYLLMLAGLALAGRVASKRRKIA